MSAAVFTNKVYADELLSLTLGLGSHRSARVLRVAKVFVAIAECMDQLRILYTDLYVTDPVLPEAIALWPNPTLHPSESEKTIPELQFYAKVNRANGRPLVVIDQDNEIHAMYLAEMKLEIPTEAPPQKVFVKFTPSYNEDAHRLLADNVPPLAPALHFCARVLGDMYMVVMEYIPESRGRSADPLVLFDGPPLPRSSRSAVKRDVGMALDLLHGQKLVFGDLREPNLLYLSGPDDGRVFLVDFDVVGRDGEARYPTCLNQKAGFCAGVERGQIMKMAHDTENFALLLGRLDRWFSRTKT